MADLIACLHPYYASGEERDFHYANKVIHSPDNISRFVAKLREVPKPESLGCHSRESTAPLEDDTEAGIGDMENAQTPGYYYEDGLQLTFSQARKDRKGISFGINQNKCDIVLPRLGGIKQCHCYLTFDDQDRLILQDVSSNGTIVTSDGKGRERRCNFIWILGGNTIPDYKTKAIVIEFHEKLKFQIVVAKHEGNRKQYIENIRRFRADATEVASEMDSPNQPRLLIKIRTLGKGGFAAVRHMWNASTGIEYACKTPLKEKPFDRKLWEKEIDIMGKIQHDHIVKLSFAEKTPLPCLYLEYLPFGNLEDQHRKQSISIDESLTILYQSLLALEYLHGQEKPIVHRDIKPENILVQTRNPLHVKLSDFGLSKQGSSLKTVCGSTPYCPPEIAKYFGDHNLPINRYTAAIDIWSLGVVILKFVDGLPYCGDGVEVDWCAKIIHQVNNQDQGALVKYLAEAMLVTEPKSRFSAHSCLNCIKGLSNHSQGWTLVPKPASYVREPKGMAAHGSAEEDSTDKHPVSLDQTRNPIHSPVVRKSRQANVLAFQERNPVDTRKRSISLSTSTSSSTGEPPKWRVKKSISSNHALENVNEQTTEKQASGNAQGHIDQENGSDCLQSTNRSWTRSERNMAEQIRRVLGKS